MADKDAEIRAVVAELDGLLAELNANVAALSAILTTPHEREGKPGMEAVDG